MQSEKQINTFVSGSNVTFGSVDKGPETEVSVLHWLMEAGWCKQADLE